MQVRKLVAFATVVAASAVIVVPAGARTPQPTTAQGSSTGSGVQRAGLTPV